MFAHDTGCLHKQKTKAASLEQRNPHGPRPAATSGPSEALPALLLMSAFALLVALASLAQAQPGGRSSSKTDGVGSVIYVDPGIPTDGSRTYDPATRRCGRGSARAYRTLRGAAGAATAGQTVLIRAGTYNEPLVPQNSGRPQQYITFRNFPKEQPVITGSGLKPAIDTSNRSYLVLEGLKVTDVRRWMYAVKAHHNVLRDSHFAKAGPTGSSKVGLFFQEATLNRVLHNTVEESAEDSLALIRSDRNLVEGNAFRKAKHALWVIKGGNLNVLRGNHFHNEWQKIAEIYDCDRVGFDHEFTLVNCTKYNVVERNTFAYTPSSGNSSPFAGIQYAGQNGIIRHNVFHSTVGPALDLTLYGREANFNTDNRVYNNVFHGTEFAGVSLSPSTSHAFSGNVFKNNILAESVFAANDTRWAWYTRELAGKPVQLLTGRVNGFRFERNAFFASKGDQRYLVTHGRRNSSANPPPNNLSWWQKQHPELFRDNLQADARFVDPARQDFHLKQGSPMIDAGAFLTRTTAAGRGTSMPVADVGWFFDGFGIPGQKGDLIQLDGQRQTARVVDIDHRKKILKLSQSLTWRAGQGVALRYFGRRPDVGAYEYVPAGAEPPVAAFLARPSSRNPMRLEFDAGGSFAPKGRTLRFDWDFGDGQGQANGPVQISHTYARAASYSAKLTVSIKEKPALESSASLVVHAGRPELSLKPQTLNFGITDTARTLTVDNTGKGTLAYGISCSAPWLKADPASGTCAVEAARIQVMVSREGLKTGPHRGWLLVDAGLAGRLRVPVSMTVPRLAERGLIKVGDTWRYPKGRAAPPPGWNRLAFDDGKWLQGSTGIGFSDDVRYPTRLDDMLGSYVSIYARRRFRLANPASVITLALGMVYDDGFVAYINGVEVARSPNMGAANTPVKFNDPARDSHDEEAAEELFPIKLRPGLLRSGANVLAIQVHNVYIRSSDLALVPRLEAAVVKPAAKPLRLVGRHTSRTSSVDAGSECSQPPAILLSRGASE